jgi:hypothetical protein
MDKSRSDEILVENIANQIPSRVVDGIVWL